MLNMHKISAKLCRLCGKEKARGTYVFKDKIKGAVLISIINKYFPTEVINVLATDTFSKYVCSDCEHKICSFDEFCLMVANVQKQLTAPSIEMDFAEDILCHFKESRFIGKNANELRMERKQHTCDQCAKSFRCQAHLDRHRRIHTGQRPFVCNICRMSFNQPEILATHMESHQGKKEFRCSTCLQSFRFKVSLKSHMLNFHSDPDNSPLNGVSNFLACTECGKAFATKYKLQRHMRSHTGERPFRCDFCHRTFSQTGNLKLHLTKCTRNTEHLIHEQLPAQPVATNEFLPEEIHHSEVDRLTLNDFSPVFISESEIQKTINETINETINSGNDPGALRSYDNQIYIDNDIETILDRDLGELNCGQKFDSVDKLALLKEPETPELLHSLLYDV